MQEYELGQYIRKEYASFLDDIYTEDLIEVISTNTERTKMSAQLVLAGLFPPVGQQVWNPELMWQPIPIYFLKKGEIDVSTRRCNIIYIFLKLFSSYI